MYSQVIITVIKLRYRTNGSCVRATGHAGMLLWHSCDVAPWPGVNMPSLGTILRHKLGEEETEMTHFLSELRCVSSAAKHVKSEGINTLKEI